MIEDDGIGGPPPQYALKESHSAPLNRQTGLLPIFQTGRIVGNIGISQLSQLISRDTGCLS